MLTHGHFDHIGAVKTVSDKLKIPVYAHKNSALYLQNPDYNLSAYTSFPIILDKYIAVKDGDTLSLSSSDSLSVKVFETPGHTTDSITFYCDEEKAAFTGDTVFKNSYGRTDFPGGDYDVLMKSIKSILNFEDEVVLYPGHGDKTTVRAERMFWNDLASKQ